MLRGPSRRNEQNEIRTPIVFASTLRSLWLNRTSLPSRIGNLPRMKYANSGLLFATGLSTRFCAGRNRPTYDPGPSEKDNAHRRYGMC